MKKVIFGLMSILMALSLTLVSCDSGTDSSGPAKITVTYQVPEGATPIASLETTAGNILNTKPISEKNGYTLTKWTIDGEEVVFPYTITESVTMVAEFTPITYTIAYKDGEDDYSAPEGTPLDASYTIESDEIILPAPVSNGRTIDWYDNVDCTGNAVTKIPTGSTGNKTFYAKWIETAVFDATVENPSDIEVAKDTSVGSKIVLTATAIEDAVYTWKCENLALDLTATTGNVCEISYDGLAKGVTYVISVKVGDFYKEVRFTVPSIS